MAIKINVPELRELKPRIVVLGVGGAGGNAINNMIDYGIQGVEFVAANTDAQALRFNKAGCKIQLGTNLTRGLGAGAKSDIGQAAAEETLNELINLLQGANMVFITAGMGGGTGTGAAPVIARAAKDLNLLTVAVVTKPFIFEGPGRLKVAERGLEELKKYVDTSIIIPNQNLFKVANEKTTFPQAFKMADNVLMQGVRGVTDLIVKPGLINLDFADIETVMKGMGKAMMGTGEAEGDKRAVMSAEAALSNPLIDDYSLKGAKGLLINITGGNDITLFEVDEAANKIRAEVDPSAEILVGSTFEESLGGKMRVSIVATGLGGEAAINNKPVVSMMRHINNRNNGYSTIYNRPNQSFVPNYVTQSAPQAMTNGATALDMFQETSHVNEVNNQTLNHMSVQEEVVNSNLSQEQKISSEDLSLLSQKENTQIVEEVASFPKLFSEDESLKDISSNKEGSSQFFKDLGHDLTDEEKVDLEIPAFLRRQTN
ncbi:cell division protein FtsZ [Candidatus Fonsibacter ubiquis]|uniref:cell division protein FtsZ n=1 Tax=Candidatus Fonsibacter ubiquis TaxID=1925548 RepID=UPI000C0811FC|nr:cell division protein FtsZ [Candidatus Fonsibacter ubiquis]